MRVSAWGGDGRERHTMFMCTQKSRWKELMTWSAPHTHHQHRLSLGLPFLFELKKSFLCSFPCRFIHSHFSSMYFMPIERRCSLFQDLPRPRCRCCYNTCFFTLCQLMQRAVRFLKWSSCFCAEYDEKKSILLKLLYGFCEKVSKFFKFGDIFKIT